MPLYKNVSDSAYYKGGVSGKCRPGETTKFADGPPEEFEDEFELVEAESGRSSDSSPQMPQSSEGEAESAQNDDEPAQNGSEGEAPEAPFNPGDFTVSQLESELEAGEFSTGELEAMKKLEGKGANRKTAFDAIDEAM